jgi:UDP-N-acetylglucosamine 2-epimerase
MDSLQLIKQCAFVVTDSGGLQKEAYWLQKKCITWRAETEWIETLKGNWNILYYRNSKKSLKKIINTKPDIHKWSLKDFGEGKAAEKIVKAIQKNIMI